MKGRIVLILVLLGVNFFGDAQVRQRTVTTLSGIITDEKTGEPLAGANILIQDARIGTVANSSGKYVFNNLPTGHHLIEVSHAGYNTIVEHVDTDTISVKNFSLSPTIVENQGVIVTGVTSATNLRRTPIPTSIVRKTQLLQTPSVNIIDAISRRPGVSQISTGPAISKPVIRGLSYNRVVTINDGIRQEGQQWGDEHGIEIDELSVNRVEIVKGPGSILYGSDAIAGVINFITNVPIEEGVVRGNIISNYQTNNNLIGTNANIAGNYHGFNWNVYGTLRRAKDYRNQYDRRVLNSRFNEQNFGGYIGLNKSWGFTHLIFSRFDQNVGLIEGERDELSGEFLMYPETLMERRAFEEDFESNEILVPYQNVKHYKLISDNSFNIKRSRLKVNVGYQNNIRSEFGNPEDLDETELKFNLKTFNYNTQLRLPEVNNWQATIGLSGMNQANENEGEESIIPNYNLFDVGAFAFVQKPLEKFTLSGGLRYDDRNINSKELSENGDIKFDAFTRNFSNISGSAGITFQTKKTLTLRANIARGFRAPTLSELASNGAHEGTNRYEYGDQDLASEKSLQFDAGVDIDYEHFSFTINGFYNRINDFIFYRRLQSVLGGDSLIINGTEELEAFRYNQNNATLRGFEFVFDLHPHPLDWLHFENTLSFVRGTFDEEVDGSNNLPMIPATRLISELRANFTTVSKTLKNVYAKLEADNTFEQNRPFTGFNTETSTPGYTLFNAGLGGDIRSNNRTIVSLHFAANNIFDKGYQSHLNRLKYAAENNYTGRRGVFNMGRNFSIKLNIPFSFRGKNVEG